MTRMIMTTLYQIQTMKKKKVGEKGVIESEYGPITLYVASNG